MSRQIDYRVPYDVTFGVVDVVDDCDVIMLRAQESAASTGPVLSDDHVHVQDVHRPSHRRLRLEAAAQQRPEKKRKKKFNFRKNFSSYQNESKYVLSIQFGSGGNPIKEIYSQSWLKRSLWDQQKVFVLTMICNNRENLFSNLSFGTKSSSIYYSLQT